MKITIKNIIKENKDIDPKQRYINGIVNMIRLPYFRFLKVNEIPRELWNDILTKVFNQEVIISDNVIYDLNDNNIYDENSDGYWSKREYDSNNNKIYQENSDGYWIKQEYDSNNNKIYQENSDGYWSKSEYDENNNKIYQENSDGYWSKSEYDENNNNIYYENSDGEIMDNRSSNSLNEDIDLKQKYMNGILNMIRRPYFNFLEVNEVPVELWKDILSKIFNTNDISWEIESRDFYDLTIQNEKGKLLYYENSNGYWEQLIYGHHTILDMDFTWYINSVGSKKVTFVGKHNPVVYSNGPTGYSWSGLSDDIKNNKFFDINY